MAREISLQYMIVHQAWQEQIEATANRVERTVQKKL